MCTSTRLIYTLTYRALREFASGRKSTNPIEVLHQMETSVPFSVCSHTHRIMMLALRSFNQRYLAPVGVHETRLFHMTNRFGAPMLEISSLRYVSHNAIDTAIHAARNRAYAARATGYYGHFGKLQSTERLVARNLPLPPFSVSLQV